MFKEERMYLDKVTRYNSAIYELKSVGLWYESLTDIEKKIPANFLKMVSKTEEIIGREFNTRFNSQTSVLNKMMTENNDKEDKNEVDMQN